MNITKKTGLVWTAFVAGMGVLWVGATVAVAQTATPSVPAKELAPPVGEGDAATLVEQGQTPLDESFEWESRADRIRRQRMAAIEGTEFPVEFRTMYLDRNKFDDSESSAWAIGGSAGLRSGYFRELLSVGSTVYTSQRLYGPEDKDGTLLLKPGQHGYTVIGEVYGDALLGEDAHAYVGRKAYDTPYINRNDVRMTPNTFEAATVQGQVGMGGDGALVNYGAGYFSKIKERNSDAFVSMSKDAGATVDRGVSTVGGVYRQGNFSLGAIDYYSDDIINIAYAEAKHTVPVTPDWKVKLAAQYSDQQSTGDDLLKGEDFSACQGGVRADVPFGGATFTVAYTDAGGDANMQNPWSGYPGYTSVQVEDFNRDGEEAILLRAAYAFSCVKGLSAYALWVNGTNPDDPEQFSKDEYDANLQWTAKEGVLKGLTLRGRYALVTQDGGDVDDLTDFRVICSYEVPWR
jgi:hypothetical protein